MNNNYDVIDKSKFVFVQESDRISDKKFDTKPVGFFKDCLNRFKKNKSSVVATFIIGFLILFAIIVPFTTPYGITPVDNDGYYQKMLPKTELFAWAGWDGAKKETLTQAQYDQVISLNGEYSLAPSAIVSKVKTSSVDGVKKYICRIDSYYRVGYAYYNLTQSQYTELLKYQEENNVQILYPLPATYNLSLYTGNSGANMWYLLEDDPYNQEGALFSYSADVETAGLKAELATLNAELTELRKQLKEATDAEKPSIQELVTAKQAEVTAKQTAYDAEVKTYKTNIDSIKGTSGKALRDTDGNLIPNYYYSTDNTYTGNRIESESSVVIDGTTYYVQYFAKMGKSNYKVRVNYFEYYKYLYGHAPKFIFGTDQFCCDIWTCLGSGARLSFILAIGVSLLNLFIGFIYGSIEGFYGGAADLIMERISDILASVPFIVVASLFQLHFADKVGTFVSLLFAFVLTGWIGIASTVRTQFYRFKNQEYILAARTLGAKDFRLIFKHIFPNAMGTIITSCVLIIPGVIFSESILSYLGIVSFKTSDVFTSIGTMLSNGEPYLSSYPHIIFFPTLFISLLEISFNLFGNGLRDAFNPSLRGSED